MKDWIRRFFAVDNSVNEDTVMGLIFALYFIVCLSVPPLSGSAPLAGAAMAAFFGKNLTKK